MKKEDIDLISVLLANLTPVAIGLLTSLGMLIYAFKDALSKKILGYKKNTNNDHRIKELINHDLFNVVNQTRSSVKNVKFYSPNEFYISEFDSSKSKMFQDFMNFKLNSIESRFKIFLNDVDLLQSNDGFKNSIFTLLNEVVEDYLHDTERHFLEKGVPYKDTKFILELFEKWREETINGLIYRINSIFASDSYGGKYEKLLGTLEVVSYAVYLVLKDGINSFEEVNGKFKNLEY